MNIPDLKQLKDLLKLLRSQGVTNYNSTDLQLVLSENFVPPQSRRTSASPDLVGPDESDLPPEEEIEKLLAHNDLWPTNTES